MRLQLATASTAKLSRATVNVGLPGMATAALTECTLDKMRSRRLRLTRMLTHQRCSTESADLSSALTLPQEPDSQMITSRLWNKGNYFG